MKRTSRLFDVILIAALVGLVVWVNANKLAIRDWLFLRGYQPDPAIARLADQDGLTGYGRQLFYRGDPQLVDRATIKTACGADIIGCTDGHDRIYLLKEDQPSDHDEVLVTAAHEMLHLAYRRLPKTEKVKLTPLIEADASRAGGSDITKEVQRLNDTAELVDEEHSLLGSEYGGLSPALESYYTRYFTKRAVVVGYYQASNHQ